MVRKAVLALSAVLLLGACATAEEDLLETPQAASPQPAALKGGLQARYLFASFDTIPGFRSWLRSREGREGPPLMTLTYYMDDGEVLTSGAKDYVGAHIVGYLHLDKAGAYSFQVTNNDGVRIHLGGALLYDDPRTGPDRSSPNLPVMIETPGWYDLEIFYFEKRGTATLDVLWTPPGASGYEAIPAAALKHE